MEDGKLLLRPTEAAAALGISRAKLYQLLAGGQIGSLTIGASRRIPATELQGFVERLQSIAQPEERAEPVMRSRTTK